ncbi:MAG TPA: signal peptidase II [Acidimicrobiia bacterium]|nr:signal peptidase II [Acidimicrobiia bacterium]
MTLPMAVGVTVVLVADQTSKGWAHTFPWAEPVANPDLALGVAGGKPFLLTTVMIIALAVFGRHLIRKVHTGQLSVAVAALLLGGAAGNLIDRALLGSVRDFIPTPWLIFNLADVALLAGVIGYFLFLRLLPRPPSRADQPVRRVLEVCICPPGFGCRQANDRNPTRPLSDHRS